MRVTVVQLLAASLLLCPAASSSDAVGETEWVSWWPGPENRVWSTTIDRGPGLRSGPLRAPIWFKPLPDLDVETFEGNSRPISDYSGRVLVLDFWATWCEPCRVQLPLMQRLREATAEDGAEILAVNMSEDAAVALPYADSLGLDMPVVKYSQAMDRTLRVQTLPTTIVVDRWGRIRARFDGYRENLEERVGKIVRNLLEESAPPGEKVAEVLSGRGRFEPAWSRELTANLSALAHVETEAGEGGVLAVAGRELYVLGEKGRTIARQRNARGAGLILSGDLDGNGESELIGYRPGSARMARLDLADGRHEAWEVEKPVLDAAVVPARSADSPGHLLLETTGGLRRVDANGRPIGAPVALGGFWDLAVAVWAGERRPVLLEPGVALHWLSPELAEAGRITIPENSRTLIDAGRAAAGVGIASTPHVSAAAGSWLSGGAAQLALALSDRLIVLDLEAGAVLFHAEWPGIAGVCATDLDGDGTPELAVASGRRTTLLRAP